MVKRRFEIDAERLPDLSGMMLVTIEALKNLGGSATIQELDEKVIELEGVTEAEQTFTMPDENQTRVNYYLAWARTHLKRGNALVNSSRGVWAALLHKDPAGGRASRDPRQEPHYRNEVEGPSHVQDEVPRGELAGL